MDKNRIDSHKLMLHPRRVADWLEGKRIAPIYMEISPSGACNHRCSFCVLDFMGYTPRFLPTEILCKRLQEMGRMGLKSVMYAGEGEPFLHKDMVRIAQAAHEAGIDNAFTTNAVLFTADKAQDILPITSWIKVSCNAGAADTYAKIHGTKPRDFEKVFENITCAVTLRKQQHLNCTIGFQMVVLPENMHEAPLLAEKARDLGVDYLVIKPFSEHPLSKNKKQFCVTLEEFEPVRQQLLAYSTEDFRIICRDNAFTRQKIQHKVYEKCQALPFWSYMDAGGNIWACSMFLGKEHFRYGTIVQQRFQEIWEGPQREKHLRWCAENLDTQACRINCRMDAVNAYLWELTHPSDHVNFI